MNQVIPVDAIQRLDKFFKMHLINGLSGIKSPCLIGTKSHRGINNLALFNSVIHLGAAPPLMGFMLRPLTVPRHTYHNILAHRHFTINHVTEEIFKKAHQTSANYPEHVSEFDSCSLTPYFSDQLVAPYVAESPLKIGLQLEETHPIQANGNTFVVGRIIEIIYPDQVVDESGHIDLSELGVMGVCGLEDYYSLEKKERLPYARP
jgi:flavin reductase (DIM6/NTAB) family NADH-FMN oxidoreductase RutF